MRIDIHEASSLLKASNPVAIPTETVWGLAALMNDKLAIERLFALKGRPQTNPLIIHISRLSQLRGCISYEPPCLKMLSEAFWPGSLTLVVPVLENTILSIARSGLPSAAFRMPSHPTTLRLIDKVGPLVAPSANRSGSPSATTVQHIEADFGADFPVLFSDITPKGIESTILIWTDSTWSVGRLGAIDLNALKDVLGYYPEIRPQHADKPLCPGHLYRHYAPQAQLSLSKEGWRPEYSPLYDAVLGFSDRIYPNAPLIVSLGDSANPEMVSSNLYAALRSLDDQGLHHVFVDFDIPNSASYLAIIDRLGKAASGSGIV